MKNIFLFIFFLSPVAFSCQKATKTNGLTQTYYTINGINDIAIQATDSFSSSSLSLSLSYMGPSQETVSLSVDSLPNGIHISRNNLIDATGIPPFSAVLTFLDTMAAPGSYPVVLVSTGTISGRRTYRFNITILPPQNCYTMLTGSFSNCNSTGSAGIYQDAITVDTSSTSSVIYFHNFGNTGHTIYADLNCANGTFQIPFQSFPEGKYTGNGNFNSTSVNLSYSIYLGSNYGPTNKISMYR
jgi:hypothetical protein